MRNSKILAAVLAAGAGLAAAVALTVPAVASAHDINELASLGVAVVDMNLGVINGTTCHDYQVSYRGVSADLGSTCDAGFQANLDAFYAAAFPPPPVTTAVTTTTATTTSAAPASTTTTTTVSTDPAATAPSTDPAPAVAPATAVAPTVAAAPAVDPNADAITQLQADVAALQLRLQLLEDRVTAIEQGQIVGETKNEAPFTTPAA